MEIHEEIIEISPSSAYDNSMMWKNIRVCLIGFVLMAGLMVLPAFAELSEETPLLRGVLVSAAEFSGDLFFFLQISENEDENLWIKFSEETHVVDQFGHDLSIFDIPLFSEVIVLCFEFKTTFIEIIDAIIIYPDFDDDEENEDD